MLYFAPSTLHLHLVCTSLSYSTRRPSPTIFLSASTSSTGGKKGAEDWIYLGESANRRRAQFGKAQGGQLGLHAPGRGATLAEGEERDCSHPFIHPDSGSWGKMENESSPEPGRGAGPVVPRVEATCFEDCVTRFHLELSHYSHPRLTGPDLGKHLQCWLQKLKLMLFRLEFPKLQLYLVRDFSVLLKRNQQCAQTHTHLWFIPSEPSHFWTGRTHNCSDIQGVTTQATRAA